MQLAYIEDAHLPVPEPDVTTVDELVKLGEPYRSLWWTTFDMRIAPDESDSDTEDLCGSESGSEMGSNDESK